MRLPGDRLIAASNRKRAEPKQQVDAEPGREEKQDAGIAQYTAQRNRRHVVSAFVGTSQETERSAVLKNETHGCRHRSRNRCRRSDHRKLLTGMRGQVQRRSCRCGHGEKQQKACCTKAARHCATEGEQPHGVDPKVCPVGVDESVGDKRPNIRAAAGQRTPEDKGIVVARRDESEIEQELDVLLLAQHERAHDMNKRQHSQHKDDNRRNVE